MTLVPQTPSSRKNNTSFPQKLKTGSPPQKEAFPVFFCIILVFAAAQPDAQVVPPQFPVIKDFSVRDAVFRQYREDAQTGDVLTIYLYMPKEDDNLFLLSEPLDGAYWAISTLNRLDRQGEFSKDRPLLLPSMRGIFIPENPSSDFEHLIASSRTNKKGIEINVALPGMGKQKFRFIPDADFSPSEIYFFTQPGFFSFPLQKYTLTSGFGRRTSPITGKVSMHGGLDLAAPAGTPVFAARDGRVSTMAESPIYGRYIIITHKDGWSSLYGHLSSFETALNKEVKKGERIGKVGSTGLSTGPHLHFELRKGGKVQNPQNVIKKKK